MNVGRIVSRYAQTGYAMRNVKPHRWPKLLLIAALLPVSLAMQCPPADTMMPDGNTNDNTPGGDPTPNAADGQWALAFDAANVGALSSVWGSGPNDVFVVGGRTTQAEIYHFDGSTWKAMDVPDVSLLVWVFGFGPNDVYSVGLNGSAVHYDGTKWTKLDTGTKQELWGVWGRATNDLWVVGGNVGSGDPVLMHYDGNTFAPVPVPANDRGATSLFKIWGTNDTIFAVGEKGLIIQYDGNMWKQVPTGANADDDFVSLWGTGDSNIVAVGGRATARIAHYDGSSWTTYKPGGPGLNGSFMDNPEFAVIGGVRGFVGRFEPGATQPIEEASPTDFDIHAIWGDGTGRYFAVGGVFSPPFQGVALIRFVGDPPAAAVPPEGVADQCASDGACEDNDACTINQCVSGECVFTPIDCDDGDPCTVDTCDNGNCIHTPKDCDDGNPCTIDTCDNGVCVHSPLCQPDEICADGACEPAPICTIDGDCDDGDPCTIDTCGVVTLAGDFNDDCINDANDVAPFVAVLLGLGGDATIGDMNNDGATNGLDVPLFAENLVNATQCDAKTCIHTPKDCDDGDPCTVDSCENGNCVHTPIAGCGCTLDSDCGLGETCDNGACTPTSAPDIEVGVGGGPFGCITTPYQRFENGGLLQFCEGFQGLSDVYLTIRTKGFAPNAQVRITRSMGFVGTSCTNATNCDVGLYCVDNMCSPINRASSNVTLHDMGGGTDQFTGFLFSIFFPPDYLDGREVILTITVEDLNNSAISATQVYDLILFPRRLCLDPEECPIGQNCVNNYCVPQE